MICHILTSHMLPSVAIVLEELSFSAREVLLHFKQLLFPFVLKFDKQKWNNKRHQFYDNYLNTAYLSLLMLVK